MIFIYRFRFIIFSLAFSQLIATLGFVPVTRASSLMPPANEYAIEFHPPLDRGAPDVKMGGAHRCSPSRFTPLIPLDTSRDYRGLTPNFGLTIRPNPTFWLQIRSGMEEMYFDIYEWDTQGRRWGELIYETSSDLPGTYGILSISLPSDVALEVGKTYHWYLDVLKSGEIASKSGWIERVEVSSGLSSQIVSAETSLDRARVYAEAGIWHEAFDILVRERRFADTPELEAEWEELLQSALGGSMPLPEFYEVSKCL